MIVLYLMEKVKIKFGNICFKTQKLAEDYVRNLIIKINICDSVKNRGIEYYNKLYDIILKHPDSDSKLRNIEDFKISKNKLNINAYELYIIKKDGIIEDVSWRICASGKHKKMKQEFVSALRYTIENQIYDFKKISDLTICSLCGLSTNNTPHIDHIIHFDKIVEDFQKYIKKEAPINFDNAPDNTNRRMFKEEDKEYEQEWNNYHKNNAKLRVLCKRCNLTREKY